MADYLSADAARVLDLGSAEPDPVLAEMGEHGRERGFPIVGPGPGRFLRTLARLADAGRIFEFGSGFGYSAAWFASALPDDGEIVLTDYDEDNLAEAREFLDRAGYADCAHFEAGDAMETWERYDGPFDVILIDHQKTSYRETFEMARDAVPSGGLIVADNLLEGPMDAGDVRAALEGEDADEHARGIADFIAAIRDDEDFETSIVPLGEGISVSYRR